MALHDVPTGSGTQRKADRSAQAADCASDTHCRGVGRAHGAGLADAAHAERKVVDDVIVCRGSDDKVRQRVAVLRTEVRSLGLLLSTACAVPAITAWVISRPCEVSIMAWTAFS